MTTPITMKTKLILTLLAIGLFLSSQLHAQLIVEDPLSIVQDAVNQVVDLAKYVEMVSNQVQQLDQAIATVQQIERYVQIFGDPSQIVNLIGIDGLFSELQNSGVGKTLGELQQLANSVESLRSDANGLYQSVGQTFRTPSGLEVPRAEDLYRKFAAIDVTTRNFQSVYDDVGQRRQALKGQIADTARQLQSASTDAETQKLSGVLTGQTAQLQAMNEEVGNAASQAVLQDINNRNDTAKQRQAQAEEQQAEHTEAMQNYRRTFQLNVKPAAFPK